MKKFFISIMVVAVMLNLCSCSKELIDKPDSEEAIVFDNVQTRDIVNSADDILSMGVFAQMNLGDVDKGEAGSNDYIMLLDNEHVSRISPEAPWTYEHIRYWVPDRLYHFFAVWPYIDAKDNTCVTNVSSVAGDDGGAYGYSVTFDTPEKADKELLIANTTVKTKTGEDFPESVGLGFQHALAYVNLKIWRNGADVGVEDEHVKVKKVTISNVKKKGTLDTKVSVDSSGDPIWSYDSNWSYYSAKINFTTEYPNDGITVSPAQIIDGKFESNGGNNPGTPFGDGLLLIPQTITSGDPVLVTVVYNLYNKEDGLWEEKRLMAPLPEGKWPAGKRLTYNLILSGDKTYTEFEIKTVVEDWDTQTDNINFTDQIEVRPEEKMQWLEGTYENINIDDGEVVLFTDLDKVAVCRFNIRTPVGATWTASLIPLTASAMDAFSIVDGSKYGVVGTNDWQYVRIKINNPDPISAMNACKLRITVQTSDGRTIVVKGLMPEGTKDNIEEFTIIQNLING